MFVARSSPSWYPDGINLLWLLEQKDGTPTSSQGIDLNKYLGVNNKQYKMMSGVIMVLT